MDTRRKQRMGGGAGHHGTARLAARERGAVEGGGGMPSTAVWAGGISAVGCPAVWGIHRGLGPRSLRAQPQSLRSTWPASPPAATRGCSAASDRQRIKQAGDFGSEGAMATARLADRQEELQATRAVGQLRAMAAGMTDHFLAEADHLGRLADDLIQAVSGETGQRRAGWRAGTARSGGIVLLRQH